MLFYHIRHGFHSFNRNYKNSPRVETASCETIITPALPCQYHFAQVGIRSTLEFATRKQRFKILVRNWRTMSTENKRPALAKTEKYELDLDIESRMPGAKNVFLARPNDCML